MSGPRGSASVAAGLAVTVVASLLAAGLATGCRDPITEVVAVFRSDLVVPNEADSILIAFQPGDEAPPSSLGGILAFLPSWPVSLGFSSGGTYGSFSITVQLLRSGPIGQMVVVSRSVEAIRFVDEETRMFVLELPRACACQGTTCPSTEDHPECASLVDPPLLPLDPAVAPSGPGGLALLPL